MNIHSRRFLGLLLLTGFSAELCAAEPQLNGTAAAPGEPLSLWYRQPAAKWTEALPVGNGRLGAMAFGGINRERLQLNDDTLWGGGPYDPVNTNGLSAMPEIRQLVFAGKYRQAGQLISQKVLSIPHWPASEMPYETAGDLMLAFPESASVENYRRDLNLDTAAARQDWTEIVQIAGQMGDRVRQNRAEGELAIIAGVEGDLPKAGLGLWRAIQTARFAIRKFPVPQHRLKAQLKRLIESEPNAKLDYIEFFNTETLAPVSTVRFRTHMALAVFVGKTRLIDNAPL